MDCDFLVSVRVSACTADPVQLSRLRPFAPPWLLVMLHMSRAWLALLNSTGSSSDLTTKFRIRCHDVLYECVTLSAAV